MKIVTFRYIFLQLDFIYLISYIIYFKYFTIIVLFLDFNLNALFHNTFFHFQSQIKFITKEIATIFHEYFISLHTQFLDFWSILLQTNSYNISQIFYFFSYAISYSISWFLFKFFLNKKLYLTKIVFFSYAYFILNFLISVQVYYKQITTSFTFATILVDFLLKF